MWTVRAAAWNGLYVAHASADLSQVVETAKPREAFPFEEKAAVFVARALAARTGEPYLIERRAP